MDAKELKKIIDSRRPYSRRTFDQKSYKVGVNSAIYHESAKPAPDNRIPVPFVRRAIKLIKGYFAKVGNIQYSDDSGWFDKNIKPIYDKEGEELATAEVFEDACVYGSGFELHWFDDTFNFGTLPIDQCIPIYTDDLKPQLKEFIWYRKLQSGEMAATYYSDKEYIEYREEKDEWKEVAKGVHLYGRVPVLEANVDRDKKNLFDHVLPMLDFYDRLTSNTANEHEKFAESLLLLRDRIDAITKDTDGKTNLDKVAEYRVLDGLGEDVTKAAAYLERNVNDTFISNSLDRLERLLYEMLCIVNYSADNFAEASGIAQAYKLLSQELMIADVESYFVNFLYDRIELIANHSASAIPDKESAELVTVNFRRNLPFDVQSMITNASVALGGKQVLSHETLLRMFPSTIVDNPELEMKRIEKETKPLENPDRNAEGVTNTIPDLSDNLSADDPDYDPELRLDNMGNPRNPR